MKTWAIAHKKTEVLGRKMLIFWDAGLVLLAMPKTGTQALEAALAPQADLVFRNPPKLKHMRLTWAEKALPKLIGREEWPRFRTIAVVREPFDWLGSWYRYRRRDALAGRPTSTIGLSFGDFLTAHIADRPPEFANVGRQSRFVQSADGMPGVDYLFAYERMDVLLGFLEDALGRKIVLERKNASPEGNLDVPEPLAQQVKEALAADFALHQALLDEAASFD